MRLPFSHDQFLAVFAAYNSKWWPVAALLWILSAAAVAHVYLRRDRRASRVLAAVLAIQWLWVGAMYHLVYFRPINPAATWFGLIFLVEAGLLFWLGVVRSHLIFQPASSSWALPGALLIGYALLYPAIGALTGLRYPEMPTFGVPCPTALLTVGGLLLVPRREARPAAIIPILWCAVGGSAAFLLAIPADLMLLVAGAALLIYILAPATREAGATA